MKYLNRGRGLLKVQRRRLILREARQTQSRRRCIYFDASHKWNMARGQPSPDRHGQDVPVEAGKFMIQGFLMKKPKHDYYFFSLIHSPGVSHVGLVPFWLMQIVCKHEAHNARNAETHFYVWVIRRVSGLLQLTTKQNKAIFQTLPLFVSQAGLVKVSACIVLCVLRGVEGSVLHFTT